MKAQFATQVSTKAKEAAIAITHGDEERGLVRLTLEASLTQLELIGGLIWASLIRNHKGFEKDNDKILAATSRKRLFELFDAFLSADLVVERLKKTAKHEPQGRSQVLRMAERLGQLGLCDKEERSMNRLSAEEAAALRANGEYLKRAGQTKAGGKTGKQSICEYRDISIPGLIVQAAGVIKRVQWEADGYSKYMPSHHCKFLNSVYKKLGGPGSIFGNLEEQFEDETELMQEDIAQAEIRIAGLQQAISEDFDRLDQLKSEGIKPSPAFWAHLKSMQQERNLLMRRRKRWIQQASIAIEPEFLELDLPF
jgi:hypothetical protein